MMIHRQDTEQMIDQWYLNVQFVNGYPCSNFYATVLYRGEIWNTKVEPRFKKNVGIQSAIADEAERTQWDTSFNRNRFTVDDFSQVFFSLDIMLTLYLDAKLVFNIISCM